VLRVVVAPTSQKLEEGSVSDLDPDSPIHYWTHRVGVLLADLAAAQQAIERWRTKYEELEMTRASCCVAMEEGNERLKAGLRKYGRHVLGDCPKSADRWARAVERGMEAGPCTCGLDALLKEPGCFG
jgi:hypothetical protein